MEDALKAQLTALLQKSNQAAQAVRSAEEERAKQQEQFVETFSNICQVVATPALEEMGEFLLSQNLHSVVRFNEEKINTRGGMTQASLVMAFSQKEKPKVYNIEDYPRFTLFCDKINGRVNLHISTIGAAGGGEAGPFGYVGLEQIDAAFLQSKVAEFLIKWLRK